MASRPSTGLAKGRQSAAEEGASLRQGNAWDLQAASVRRGGGGKQAEEQEGRLEFKLARHVFASRVEQEDRSKHRKEQPLGGMIKGDLRPSSSASVREDGGSRMHHDDLASFFVADSPKALQGEVFSSRRPSKHANEQWPHA